MGLILAARMACVTIAISGEGVPPELSDRIFEPFFTTRSDGQGIGLGLDLVRRIIRRHGGTVQFARVDGWTVFTVELPLADVSLPQSMP